MSNIPINEFGYSEMYEWKGGGPEFPSVYPEKNKSYIKFGKFVQFASDNNIEEICDENAINIKYNKIELFHDNAEAYAGVTTVNSSYESDNPNEWPLKFISNEFGDKYVKKTRLAVGQCLYEQNNEIQIMQTRPVEQYVPLVDSRYDKSKEYVKRTDRKEWIKVNILGKCVVEDNGKCFPGKYCTPYVGPYKDKWGTAVPASSNDKLKFFVLERISDHTIMIMNKPTII